MKTPILGFVFTFLVCFSTLAQSKFAATGFVVDTASSQSMQHASLMVLNAKDSTLVSFTRADEAGFFAISKLNKGHFILLVTFPRYADYVDNFTLDSLHSKHDFGKIKMILKAWLLADVIVKAKRAAVKVKGDTTEFNAENFKIQPNAKVEDLLKQLPGITIDKDGKITAQGQAVNKVLVDGEEFFGDDPTLVTKNIRADMVDKVQLYDKKSDQATFTGIDDGKKDKTINIKLKADKKNGYFGKAEAGVATDDYYQGQLLFNRFKKKLKFSAYGTLGNTGKTGLGWEDSQKYGSSSDNLEFTDGGIYFTGSNDDLESFDGRYNGQGIPLAKTGGLHYDSKWNDDKESLNANYKAGSLNVDGSSNNLSQNNLPGSIINSNSNQVFNNYMFRQKLGATYQIKLDTSSNLKIVLNGTQKNSDTHDSFNSMGFKSKDTILNTNRRVIDNKVNTQNLDAGAFYTKKLKKTGRTFSIKLSEVNNQSEAKGFLRSELDLYNTNGKIDSSQHIDQYKTSTIKSSTFQSIINYTEPLSKYYTLVLNYGLGMNNSTSDRRSFNQSLSGKYDTQVDSLSNKYRLDELSNLWGTYLNFKKKKTTFNFGTKISDVTFNQLDEFTGSTLKRNFINWNAAASFQYRFSQQQSLRFNYYGNTVQPTINQIQPIIVNTDPLNITLGNPGLRPSFNNSFNMGYNSYKVLSGQYIGVYGNYSITSNPIVSNQITNSVGKSINQYINLSNKKTSNFYLSSYLGRKIKKADLDLGLEININGNNAYNLVNQKINLTKLVTYGSSLRVSKYKEKKYDFFVSFGPNYTVSGSSLQPQINNNGSGFNSNFSFTIYLPAKFQVHSDGSFEYRTKTETFNQDFHRTLMNASLSRTFFKADNLKFTVSGNDLLNQNVGFSRNATGNFITQSSYTTIKRYFMFSIIWDFNKAGGK